ncbi:MAG: sigma-70 family RNA polymerase sigma factor [Actinomycetota bacterium]
MSAPTERFAAFASDAGLRLRQVLVAQHGVDVGTDLAADALAYAWEHWSRIEAMDNPVGYLYRVARTAGRRHRRLTRPAVFPPERERDDMPFDIGLHRALASLPERRRTCVVLVHVYDWSYGDTASALDVTVAVVRNEVHRGLRQLRNDLGGSE